MRARIWGVTALVAVGLVAGCSSSKSSSSSATALAPATSEVVTNPQPTTGPATTTPTTAATPPDVRTLVTLADAQTVLGPTAIEASTCTPSNCNYTTYGGIGALTVVVTPSASQATFASLTTGYDPFAGAGDAAAYEVNATGTGEVTFLHGSVLVTISARIASASEAVVPVSASALERLATAANGRI